MITPKLPDDINSINQREEFYRGIIQCLDELGNSSVASISGNKNANLDIQLLQQLVQPPVISYLSKSGHNSQFMVVNGRLYSTSGANTNYENCSTGRGGSGQNPFYGVDNFKQVPIPTNSPIKKVGGGYNTYAYALLESGDLYTWGGNQHGQCGLGHINAVATPTLAATGVIDVIDHPSQGEYHVYYNRLFIIKADGLYAAGNTAGGQCGVNATADKTTFTKCTGFDNTSSTNIKKVYPIGSTSGFTFLLTADGKIYFAGTNNTGVAGLNTTTDYITFTDVTQAWAGVSNGVLDIKVVGGSRYYDIADNGSKPTATMLITLLTGTLLRSCGHNEWGSLGDGTTTARKIPVQPLNVPEANVVDIAGFGSSPLTVQALCSNNDMWAWGYNGQGQVGDGTTTNRTTPLKVQTGVTKLLSNGMTSHYYGYMTQSFITKPDGLYACGLNDGGYCGLGHITTPITTFQKVLIPLQVNENVTDIGHFTTYVNGRIIIAKTSKSNLYAWGYNGNYGVCIGSTINCLVPVQFKVQGVI